MTQSSHSQIKAIAIRLIALFFVFVAFNLALDETLCVIPPYISKHSAFESIQVGGNSDQARKILWRAGVLCASEGMFKCRTLMFSDFWRSYSISFDAQSGIVVEKEFVFRFHGNGLIGRLLIRR